MYLPHVKAVVFDVSPYRPVHPAVLTGTTPDRLPYTLHAVAADRRCCSSEPVHRDRRLRVGKRIAAPLLECIHVSTKSSHATRCPSWYTQNVPRFVWSLAKV